MQNRSDAAEVRAYRRYVALGDSQTEGVGDGDGAGGLRGWADRFAEVLDRVSPGVEYANLAVRGKLAGQVRAEQLAAALGLRPDLATVVAGVNDLMRPRFDAGAVAGELEAMFAALTAGGAHVVTLTFPDVGRIAPLTRPLRPRVRALNAAVRAAAARHGVTVVETEHEPVATDPRLWSADRLHASPVGHARIAAAVAQALHLPDGGPAWNTPFPTPAARLTLATEARWAAAFLAPWVARHARGRSSGTGRTAKRPDLLPVAAPYR
ncbi:SGNH/GDSL hydrolase family protein [Actinacidiphila bryophytorum]|uniref:Lysophospholipase L1 n=1 Tax=Actinacidiphila bryophytorum TaxID=1436133 RepID=A0A9W4E1H2_9ACTN|nr:SGNH/GDSL hydrolase family protein [Actinacidiphila bryophytorum]MBM9435390.1 SGNH/GDSL hydrolase family protein [Actinacidiphila bryophytorum]MBN6542245.1 SGNH/GDSL hydrolase family protein [Actinacidiphila bryophytorum]CAG7607567.1 Lysophospholipase L1 [Actinacidiphila bryophytorum]